MQGGAEPLSGSHRTAGVEAERPLALVTGGSSGIGRGLVAELAGRGYDVVVAADEPWVHELPGELATDIVPLEVDLATAEGVRRVGDVLDSLPPVTFAAFNAGVGLGGAFVATDLPDQLRLVDLNIRSVVHLAHRVLGDMVRAGGGNVLVMSSIAAAAPGPFHATYAASKAFLHSFAEAVRYELRDTGVSVTSVQPGPTDTRIFARAGMLSTRIAQGRKDEPRDVAREAVEAALADRASVVTGSWFNRAQTLVGRFVPEKVATTVAARQTRPRS